MFRAVRHRLGLRQIDVAMKSRVSHTTISRIERGHLEAMTMRTIRAVAGMLEIRADLAPWSRLGDATRFATAGHAALVEAVIVELVSLGWEARPEVSFNNYGERGFIDILAWHSAARTLLVIEVKTVIVDVGETVGILDRKRRLSVEVAAKLGWLPQHVSCALVVQEGRTNRRRIVGHRATFRSMLPLDGRSLRAYLRRPAGTVGAIAFWSVAHAGNGRQRRARPRRVRVSSSSSEEHS